VLVAAGAGLRLSLIAGQRFHGDEAIYGYWAQLVASGQDPLLLSVPLDKPPLFVYLLAGVFKLFGPTEIAARLISEVASLAAVFLTYRLGRRFYGQPEALLATAAMALSPFNILFAPTVFTDPLMVALILAAMNLASASRWGWAGVTAGLAVATKQQGILFALLVAATGWIAAQRRRFSVLGTTRQATTSRVWGVAKMGLGFLGVVQLLTSWDALRWRMRASFWEQSAVSHGPLHLVNWWELGERLAGWSELLGYLFGSPVLNAVLLLGVPLLLWRGWQAACTGVCKGWGSERRLSSRAYRNQASGLAGNPLGLDTLLRSYSTGAGLAPSQCTPDFYTRSVHADWLLAGFSALFFLAHWLFSFSVWDRYLLGLVPLASLLLARVAWQGLIRAGFRRASLAGLLMVLLLATPAAEAVQERYPIGGDRGACQGLEKVIAFFRYEVPASSVVWHRYLGWHYLHYLFGATLDLRWYAEPAILAAKVSLETDRPNYMALPAWEKDAEAEAGAALKAVGIRLVPERRVWREDGSLAFTVYRIFSTDTQLRVSPDCRGSLTEAKGARSKTFAHHRKGTQLGVTWASEHP